jgi:hypothetical protein
MVRQKRALVKGRPQMHEARRRISANGPLDRIVVRGDGVLIGKMH